jgi:hypothetical protein
MLRKGEGIEEIYPLWMKSVGSGFQACLGPAILNERNQSGFEHLLEAWHFTGVDCRTSKSSASLSS